MSTQFSIHDRPNYEPPENPDEIRGREEAMAERRARDAEVCGLCGARRDQHTGLNMDHCPRWAAKFTPIREPDAMCHATHWRQLLPGQDGLTVCPYDPDRCRGDGPPWPVWIDRAPTPPEDPAP